jgi:hypothetical protein
MSDYQDKEKRNLEYRNAGIALTVTVTAFSVGLFHMKPHHKYQFIFFNSYLAQ